MSYSYIVMSIVPSEGCHLSLLVDWWEIDPNLAIACFTSAIQYLLFTYPHPIMKAPSIS